MMWTTISPFLIYSYGETSLQCVNHSCNEKRLLRNAASALLLSQSPFIEIYLNLTSTSTGELTPPVHHGLISCQSVLLYLLSTFEQ